MQNLLKNTAKLSLTVIVAFSVFMLNFSSFIHCSNVSLEDDCCHKTRTIKSCCLKHTKITFNERISSHCGCSVNQSNKPGDLFTDLKNNSSSLTVRNINYITSTDGTELLKTSSVFTSYSPPLFYSSDKYLNILSLRI